MTITAITQSQLVQPAGSQATSNSPVKSTTPSDVGAQDTVHLSSSAQTQLSAIKAAIQESTETAAQTAKEAQSGDLQARRVLAKEAAAAKAVKGK